MSQGSHVALAFMVSVLRVWKPGANAPQENLYWSCNLLWETLHVMHRETSFRISSTASSLTLTSIAAVSEVISIAYLRPGWRCNAR